MQPPETMNILVVSDVKYAQYCAVMLTSLLENNKNENIDVYMMTAGLDQETIDFLKNIVETRYGKHLYIFTVDERQFKDCPVRVGDHITVASYYRIICADILPESIDKILYLDCDVIVRDSLREFWDYNIDNYALAATLDPGWTQGQKYERLGLNPDDSYFCSGVMLINLKHWRKVNATKECFEVLAKMKDNLLQHDQDILNVVFNKQWLRVSYRWDYCGRYQYYKSEQEFLRDLRKESKYYPVIIHFTNGKPWESRGFYFYQSEFDHYYQLALGKKNKARYRYITRIVRLMNKYLGLSYSYWEDKFK